jgi:propionate CoA-transferase
MRFLKVQPLRTAVDGALGRMAASVLLDVPEIREGASVDIGTGLPETACAALFECGALSRMEVLLESGTIGGMPSPGAFFGTSIFPERMVSSAALFRRVYSSLDAILVGALEVQGDGSVNASRRGRSAEAYVGPGGFIDFTVTARVVVFCLQFQVGARTTLVRRKNGRTELSLAPETGRGRRTGNGNGCKFVGRVAEVTFSGPEALRRGQRVVYVTPLGALELTESGLVIRAVAPGVDARRDMVMVAARSTDGGCALHLPTGSDSPVEVSQSVMTGEGFAPQLRPRASL